MSSRSGSEDIPTKEDFQSLKPQSTTPSCFNNNTASKMSAFAIKAAGRTAFRRSPFPTRPIRGNHTKSPATKADENPAKGTSIPVANTVANLPIWHRLGPLSRAFQAYGRSQRNHPLKTQFFSALVIFSLGDLSAQSINGDEYNPARTLRALIIGAGAAIPSYKW